MHFQKSDSSDTSKMAEQTKELNKLADLHSMRPSFSRMISWEMGRTRDPVRKIRQKKNKVGIWLVLFLFGPKQYLQMGFKMGLFPVKQPSEHN